MESQAKYHLNSVREINKCLLDFLCIFEWNSRENCGMISLSLKSNVICERRRVKEMPVEKPAMVNDLTQGSILKKLILFALPFMAANLLNTLYTLVDLAIIGKFLGSEALAAASNGGQIVFMLYAIGIGLGGGGQVLISQLTGAGKRDEYQSTIGTLVTFGILSAIVTTLIALVFPRQLLELINTPPEAVQQGVEYLRACAYGFAFCVGFNTFSAVLRGMGDSRTPFLISAVCAVMNVILDLLLVAVIPMGVAGAALATAISQAFSFVFAVWYLCRRKEQFGFDFKLRSFRIYVDKLKIILKLSVPLMVSSISISMSLTFINSFVNPYGVVASAVNGVGSKLSSLMQVVTHALQPAVGAFVGQNMGAGKPERARKAVWCALGIGVAFWCIIAGLCLCFPRGVFSLFSDEAPVLDLAVSYLRISVWNYLAWAIMSPALGLMSGVGAANLQLFTSLLDGVVARIGLSLLLGITLAMGLTGFWIGSVLATYVTVILAWLFFFFGRWENRSLLR